VKLRPGERVTSYQTRQLS